MDKLPDPRVCEEMRALCRRISVAHDLDPEIQEELYGHMEDKAIAYISGQEPLSDDDVLLLVREHFGDPATVKSLLQDVHVHEARISAARRILGVLIVSLRLFVVFNLVFVGLAVGLAWWTGVDSLPAPPPGLLLYLVVLGFAIMVTQLWRAVTRWQNALTAGEQPWVLRYSTRRLLLHAAAPLLILAFLPWVNAPALARMNPVWLGIPYAGFMALLIVAHSVAWIRWCDQPPRRARIMANAIGAWVLFWIFFAARPHVELALHPGAPRPEESPGAHFLLVHGTLPGTEVPWQLGWVVPTGYGMLFSVVANMLALVALGGLGYLFHALRKRSRVTVLW